MAGTSKGAKQAASTRKKNDPQSFEKMGAKGGSSHSRSGTSNTKKGRK